MTGEVAIGLGCTSDASAEAILRVIGAARSKVAGAPRPSGLYSHERKAQHVGLNGAAAALGLQLRCFSEGELKTVEPHLVSRSARVAALTGVGSVAEAAALLGAGPRARIVMAKLSAEGVSCAIAAGVPA